MDTTPVATAITIIAPDGYVGEIRVLVGIDSNDRIVRARVLEHRETPGLGDKIDATKSNWINQFDNRQLAESSWTLERDGGDIDHITGATITSRAVVNAIRRALELQRIYGARISESPAESELELAAPEAAN
jgi:electron transport complex protein RnfG